MRLDRFGRVVVPVILWLSLSSPAAAAPVTLTGKVTDQGGVGIFNVTINFVDSCTGITAGAINNVTSSTGSFQAAVNPGIYDLEISPPSGSLFAAQRILNFDLTSSKTLATVVLQFGIIVTGHVTDTAGLALADVYVHFYPPGATERFFTVRDKTDLSGNYSVVVPTIACGLYDVKYGPPLGTHYLALTNPSVPIPGNTTLPAVALATGILITGTVSDSAGAGHPIINVNMDAVDATTGADIVLSHDRTDATGTYTIAVPPGTYLIDSKPEKCTLLVAQVSAPVTVAADMTLPPVVLSGGVLVKGLMTDTRGVPVADANSNYFRTDPVTNKLVQVLTWDDHSDATGAYSAVIPGNDTYTIDYFPPFTVGCPPVTLRLAAVRVAGVVINNNPPPLPTVQFPDGFLVTGRNITVTRVPVANVDLSFYVAGTFNKVFVGHHHGDSAGNFAVVVVPGTYDIRFEPATTDLAAKRLFGIGVSGDRSVGDVILEQGFVVSGQVTDSSGLPVYLADLNFFDVYTGLKSDTPHDNTDTSGNYSVVVPPRTYNVNFIPPPGVPLATVRIPNVVITASRSGLNAVLPAAFAVSGFVRNSAGLIVPAVDLNFFLSGTTTRQIVSRDNTDATGFYSVYVPPGIYDIVFTPDVTTPGLAMARVNGVIVQADTSLPDVVLVPALTAGVGSIAPSSGPSSGGTPVTILGSNFQPLGTKATLGGLNLFNVVVVSSGQINAVTPAYPVGSQSAVVDLAVGNFGSSAAVLPSAFTFTPPASPIDLAVTRGSFSIVLSWPSTGQASFTIYRSTSPGQFGQAQLLAITTATSFTDVGADGDGVTYFYRVE